LHPRDTDASQSLVFDLAGRFPYHHSGTDPVIDRVDMFLKIKGLPVGAGPIPAELYDNADGTGPDWLTDDLASDPTLGGLHHAGRSFSPPRASGVWMLRIQGGGLPAFIRESVTVDGAAYHHLNRELLEDLYLVVQFSRP
jgi:hypothetical protein